MLYTYQDMVIFQYTVGLPESFYSTSDFPQLYKFFSQGFHDSYLSGLTQRRQLFGFDRWSSTDQTRPKVRGLKTKNINVTCLIDNYFMLIHDNYQSIVACFLLIKVLFIWVWVKVGYPNTWWIIDNTPKSTEHCFLLSLQLWLVNVHCHNFYNPTTDSLTVSHPAN